MFKRVLKAIGRTAAKPITVPIKAAQRGTEAIVKDMILGMVRHSLTTGGGALVASGYLGASDLQAGVGAIITLIGIVWSVIQKRKAMGVAK